MSAGDRSVWITGIGIVSSLGEGQEAHHEALVAGAGPNVDRERFAPYPVHPIVPLELDRQIPKKGDQRQMEPWQRIGTYAAGLALEDAGVKGDEALLDRTDMIVAAGGGERDAEVDSAIVTALRDAEDPERLLNAKLSTELRPTLFLAQLPNLLAGNISIVHKVTGSSRTLMGEEAAGMSAISSAHGRIAAGQSEICLVGGSYNAERWDMLLLLELGGFQWREDYAPVWERAAHGGGVITGSVGAFLVLESESHARARGAEPIARISGVQTDYTRRGPGDAAAAARRQLDALAGGIEGSLAVFSGATGIAGLTEEEQGFLQPLADGGGSVRALGSAIGHGLEIQFPALVALAAINLKHGGSFAPRGGNERPATAPDSALVNCWGHWRGEAMALLRKA
ncbi:beta-ketoacyl-ACP synthase [Lutibaculum baratangense]|nr:beta-ketoacyl-ACP synthase [Lutibaculum baratangense]